MSRATGACLDDSLDKGTRSYACNGMSYQRWTVRTTADGGTRLRNHASGSRAVARTEPPVDRRLQVPCGGSYRRVLG
ncbi:hypothetical protein ACFXGT_02965 [Streptomyces sp. NPDC059352]|uniref:hypothetical protein n=1 Tax=Streptomyces sp. NPDC059352 TaxID=3346810 RepID=UPI0036A49C3B